MSETLEARTVQVRQIGHRGRAPETLSDLGVEADVADVLPYVQPRPSQWFRNALSQLDRLLELPPNWDSYNADPIEREIVASAKGLLDALADVLDLPCPLISPTRNGGVLLEWSVASKEFEIQLVSRDAASFVFADEETGQEYEGAIFRDRENLGDPAFFALLRRMC